MSHLFKSSVAKWGLLVSVIVLTLLVVSLSALPGAAQGTIHKVYITSVNDQSFAVSWTTDAPVTSSINYGITTTALSSTKADSLNPTATTTHYVDVTGLSASTTYYFQTVSGSTVDNNGGAYYSVRTGPVRASSPGSTLYGYVYSSGTPVGNAIVYLQAMHGDGSASSQLASVRTSTTTGYYVYNLNNLRTANFSNLFNPDFFNGDTVTVTAQGGNLGTVQVITVVPETDAQIDLNLNGNPNAITLHSLTSRAESSVWVPVGLALLGTAAIVVVVARRRRS